jgi:ribosomal protein S19
MKKSKILLKKYNNLDFNFFYKQNINNKKIYNIKNKNTLITPEYLNCTLNVYSGNIFKKLSINTAMLNYILGSFILTKRKSSEIHKKKK